MIMVIDNLHNRTTSILRLWEDSVVKDELTLTHSENKDSHITIREMMANLLPLSGLQP